MIKSCFELDFKIIFFNHEYSSFWDIKIMMSKVDLKNYELTRIKFGSNFQTI
jgi:hypothetical protein